MAMKWLDVVIFASFWGACSLLECSVLGLKGERLKEKVIQVNRKGPYIGLITVYPPEEDAFFSTGVFKPDPINPFLDLSGRRYRVGRVYDTRVIYVKCGLGLINAAATTQQMVDRFEIGGIIHFGIAGNINDSMSIGDVTIPQQFVHSGLWDWLNPNGTVDASEIAGLDVKNYNTPKKIGDNLLGHLGFSFEQLYSVSGEPNTPQTLTWAKVDHNWLNIAKKLEGTELRQCVNSSFCLEKKPKVVVGLRGSSANIFVDNAAFRDFIFNAFNVSSHDMESSAVVMVSLSNGYPVIVIRGLSDIAGKQEGTNAHRIYGSLAALNTANSVIRFLKLLPPSH